MKVGTNVFKGRIPKISDSELPNENATVAQNCRLRSGDLEPYNGLTVEALSNKVAGVGGFNTIYPMDRDGSHGGPFWLTWPTSQVNPAGGNIDVVRGNLLQDTTERTFYTGATDAPLGGGLYRPKFTNIPLATTAPVKDTGYPYDWRLLGVPSPGTFNNTTDPPEGLIVSQELDTSTLSYSTISDGSTLDGWTLSTQVAAKSTVTVNAGAGNPAPSIDILMVDPAVAADPVSSYLYRDLGMLNGPGSFRIDIDAVTGLADGVFYLFLGTDQDGNNGLVASIPYGNGGGNTVVLYKSNGWGNLGGAIAGGGFWGGTSNPNSPINTNTFYTLQFDYFNVDGQINVYDFTITLLSGAVTVSTVQINNVSVSGNTFFGAQLLTPNGGTVDLLLDNIQLIQIQLLDNPAYEATAWTYTYVDDFGQESAPAPSSGVYFIGPNITTTLTNWDGTGVTGYDIVSINLYRAVTGSTSTQFQFEDNLPLSTTTYTDTKKDSELGEVLETDNYDLPPDDAQHITNLPNGITLIASSNQICPSVQYRPYAYPVEYRLATDYPVVAMIGLETAAVVLTEESAYLVIGSDPSQMSMSKITPQYGCVSKKSAIRWGNTGIVYASNQGLVMVGMQGSEIITKDFITLKEWASYGPSTIEGAIYEDMYYGFYVRPSDSALKAFIFDVVDAGVGFIDLTIGAQASFSEHLFEKLYMIDGTGVITSWNTNQGSPLSYVWRSKLWQNPYPITYGCGQVRGDYSESFSRGPIVFKLYKDELNSPYFTSNISNTVEFVTPANVSFDTQIELSGAVKASSVYVAEDMVEL